LIAELPKEETFVGGIAISPSGDRLAVVASGRVAVWTDWDSQPKLLWKRSTPGSMRVAFSPDEKIVAVASFQGNHLITLFDAATGVTLEDASFDRSIMELSFSSNGKYLASIDWDGLVELYDIDRQQAIFRKLAHNPVGFSVAFSPDGQTLVTANSDPQVKFWNVPTMMHLTTITASGRVGELAFFPDGKTLAVGYLNRTIELWHVDRDKERLSIDGVADTSSVRP
jgi:WD40 repeat protein